MINRTVVAVLRILLIGALAATIILQVIGLPWLSGVMAQDYPAEAYMRWPILVLSILGLGCVEVGIICTLRLISFTLRDEVFSRRALRWVDGIIGAFLAGALVCLATIVYQSFTVGGPPGWMLVLLSGVLGGIGLALLMVVMRSLLLQATSLRTELATVI
ncbi:MAG TPA: DUF2975 domain-containing protein [Yaniella sp.]